MKLRFVKIANKWFCDIPDYEGMIEELEMVDGADTMLDDISNYYKKVSDPNTIHVIKEWDDELRAFVNVKCNYTLDNGGIFDSSCRTLVLDVYTEEGEDTWGKASVKLNLLSSHGVGATYEVNDDKLSKSILTVEKVWLCPVTIEVFGNYPKKLIITLNE
ncbi:hypothetical protein EZS27_010882 [termite gut metagenome]|uniref:Uncharacterized protein n=1 Tax=termite gut metagenome TaxID=433724 RepID=A0A5J4S7A5_9ZZZZ